MLQGGDRDVTPLRGKVMNRPCRVFLATIFTLGASSIAARADSIVYQSVPDLTDGSNIDEEWCSDCYGGGVYEPLDQFTLSEGYSITDLELATFADSGYDGLAPFTFEVYNSDHSAIIFSEAITPTLVTSFTGDGGFNFDVVEGTVTGLTLGPGTYWAGFIAPSLVIAGYSSGGNGSLIETTPHTGTELFTLGGNSGYALSSGAVTTPEPSTWAMMLLGFAGLGFAGYRRARAGHATLAA
jgi:PEP-CTERM motif